MKLVTSGLLIGLIGSIFIGGGASEADPPPSAAMRRFKGDDSENELYTRFRYQPVSGLGYEPGIHRRDPSTIIKVHLGALPLRRERLVLPVAIRVRSKARP